MKEFVLGAAIAVLLIVGGFLTYFAAGFAPVATAAPPMPFEKSIAKMALHARLKNEMPAAVPIPSDDANMTAGAKIYADHCALCHGLPGQQEPAIAKGMFPDAPQLFQGKGVTDDPPGESYWKAANGIRMTGMPAFKDHLSETELWQVALLVANADKLSPPVKAALTAPAEADPETSAAPPGAHQHQHQR
jgi:thiosulfate dehydrogenase